MDSTLSARQMKTLYTGEFLRIDYDAKNSLVYNAWLPETINMTDDDFKHEMLQLLKFAIIIGFKRSLANTLDFRYIITPQLKDWYNKTITPPAYAAGISKLAFLLPEGVFAQLAIEQIFEEWYEAYTMAIRYFGNEEEALKWLLEE